MAWLRRFARLRCAMCLRCLRLPRRLRPSRLVGAPRPAPTAAASALVVKGLTQALQLVDQSRALRARPTAILLAIALAVPILRRAPEARVIVDVTHD
jgi:hypothetical protein